MLFLEQDELYLLCLLHSVQQYNLLNALQYSWGEKKAKFFGLNSSCSYVRKSLKLHHSLFVLVRECLTEMMALKGLYHFNFQDRGWSWAKSLHKLYLSSAWKVYWNTEKYFSVVSSSKKRVLWFGSALDLWQPQTSLWKDQRKSFSRVSS